MIYEHGGNIYGQKIESDFSVSINPLGCPDIVKNAFYKTLDEITLYPEITQDSVRKSLADLYNVTPDNIVCGNGASELLMAAVHMVNPKQALLTAPSFYGYEHALKSIQNCDIRTYELKQENGFLLGEDILEYLTEDTDLFFVTDPNNPTGRLIDPVLMDKILERCREKHITTVIDECFLKLSDKSTGMSEYAASHDAIIVLDAFTKTLAIPGVRAGFAVASKDTVSRLRDQLPEWNLSVFAVAAILSGCRYLSDGTYLEKCREYIVAERQFLKKELEKLGITVFESDTLFMLIYTEKDIFEPLLKQGILIRDCSNFRSLSKGYYRIAIKTHEENEKLVCSLDRVIQKSC